jgi:hypothetical protein
MIPPSIQKQAVGALFAAALVFSPMQDANAARSGGRVGGRAPVSRPSVSSGTRSSFAAPARSTTNVYMAPSMGMGYGYGGGYGGGYGYGGGFGGGGGAGLYLGLSVAESFLREQQRQA